MFTRLWIGKPYATADGTIQNGGSKLGKIEGSIWEQG